MKQLAITIIFACLALTVVAEVHKPDAARLRQAFKNRPVAAATSVGDSKAGQVSFHEFMRERKVTLADNLLMKKAPSRSLSQISDRIAVAEVQAIEDFDDEGTPILTDTVFSLGWKVTVSDDNAIINGIYGSYSLPIDYDGETAKLFSDYLAHDSIQGVTYQDGVFRYRVDTIRTVILFTEAGFLGLEDDALVGTVYDDGSIFFTGKYFVYFEDILHKYKVSGNAWTGYNYVLESTDYVDVLSPMYSNLCLLEPNGVHEFDYDMGSIFDPADFDAVDFSTLVVGDGSDSGDSGIPSSGNYVVNDFGSASTSGLHPHPIDPRRTLSVVLLREDFDPWSSWQSMLDSGSGSMQAPVYMFQLDDSTLCVYNLYNAGYTASIMTLHPDGSFTMPPQVLFYGGDEDYYNCSVEGNSLVWGNTGTATNDSITWDVTVPLGMSTQFSKVFSNNKLYFTNDDQFIIGSALEPTIEVTEGVAAYSFSGLSAEVGAEVSLVLLDGEGNVIESVDNPYVVQRTDQDQNIILAAVASVPGKNDSYHIGQYIIPAKDYPRGDINHDGLVNIQDVTVLINHLLTGIWPK